MVNDSARAVDATTIRVMRGAMGPLLPGRLIAAHDP
jgi:hypothetical protein